MLRNPSWERHSKVQGGARTPKWMNMRAGDCDCAADLSQIPTPTNAKKNCSVFHSVGCMSSPPHHASTPLEQSTGGGQGGSLGDINQMERERERRALVYRGKGEGGRYVAGCV